ncbi:polyprenol reductase-like [Battus philenor]|uniref:polyprenol reductase-like n=1 Tax=Battus philenor TaxID=42288 RepID=UPI0035CF4D9F
MQMGAAVSKGAVLPETVKSIVLDHHGLSASGALVALSLTTMHCARRCWETHYLQVFSIGSKMNFLHYGAALVHYATLILAIVGQAPLFCGNQNRQFLWKDGRPKTLYATCILVFLVASYEQYKSNVILANLRKSKKTGAVITEEHGIPRGRMFQMISSPHRLCEIVLYFVIAALIPTRTMIIMSFWVFCNQIQSSVHAHEWYKKTFKNYPKSRHALLPYII